MWHGLFSFKLASVRPSICPSFALLFRKHGVGKLVMSSSPSTRFDGNDIDGLKEDDLVIPEKFLEASKIARAENFTKCGRHGRIHSLILSVARVAWREGGLLYIR